MAGDFTGLTAQGRPLSSHNTNHFHAPKPPRSEPPVNGSMDMRSLRASTSAMLTSELQSYQSKMHRSRSDIGFRLQPSSFMLSTHRYLLNSSDIYHSMFYYRESHISMDSKDGRRNEEQLPCTLV